MNYRETLKDKKKIVIKIGSSSLLHEETGGVDFRKLEQLVRIICDLKNQNKDVVLVSSGAIGVGFQALGLKSKPKTLSLKQACAAIGQGQLMMIYQKLFMEYNHLAAQVLLTFDAITSDERRVNAINTMNELLQQDVIPVVNENDTVATEEIEFGDNDTLSEEFKAMAKGSVTNYGTGGMSTKISAARIATDSGADMAILDASNLDLINQLMDGEDVGTLFIAHNAKDFDTVDFIVHKGYLD